MGLDNVNGMSEGPPSGTGDEPAVRGRLDELIAHARSGSTSALGELLQHCRRYLLLVANESLDSDLRPKGAASDLVQDTFVAAQCDFWQFHGTTEQELLAWLTSILTHRLSKNVRHYRRTLKRELDREIPLAIAHDNGQLNAYSGVTPIEAAIACDDAEQVRAALERLPSHLREVLILRTWERRSFVEIATRLQSTPDSVRKSWARALRRMQIELQKLP
jgi:RNA polymerase sigma-70 factor (ECF subfamily)